MQFALSSLAKKQLETVVCDNKHLYSGVNLRNQLYRAGIDLDVAKQGEIKGFGDIYYKDSFIKYIFSILTDKQILDYISQIYLNLVFNTPSRVSFLNDINRILKDSIQLNDDGSFTSKEIKKEYVSTKESKESHVFNFSYKSNPTSNQMHNIVQTTNSLDEQINSKSKYKIFIVHGHDKEMMLDVARTIEKLGMETIILHEQANSGKTIIEKFHSNSHNISFAIILMSPDDKGCKADLFPESVKYRARQNVILELGYFIGTLGRDKVFVLVKNPEELEIPSDILAVIYTSYKSGWEKELIKEMKVCGIDVDMNKLI